MGVSGAWGIGKSSMIKLISWLNHWSFPAASLKQP
ncbi:MULTISPECIES: hypothetical protein [unclassified Bradyrhizobium]